MLFKIKSGLYVLYLMLIIFKLANENKAKYFMERYQSKAKWEGIVGYSRAVKAGNTIYVSGTVAVDDDGHFIGRGDAYKQTVFIINKIRKAIHNLGGDLEDVVRTRIYVTNIIYWKQVGKAHGEYFKDIMPATTMIEVSNLIDAECVVEMEAEAIIPTK